MSSCYQYEGKKESLTDSRYTTTHPRTHGSDPQIHPVHQDPGWGPDLGGRYLYDLLVPGQG